MFSNPSLVISIFLLAILLMALAYGILRQRRRTGSQAAHPLSRAWNQAFSQPDPAEGERMASTIAEQIEELVRGRLDADPTLSNLTIDFGSSDDGMLEIWIEDQCYTDVNAVPDERIRRLIQEAVSAYNRGEA
jgi:hypothetical protein